MPVYNCEGYLAEAVRSVLSQTLRDFEFLIVDDGSTDHSLPVLRDFAAKDARIRLVSRPNTGITPALNEMIGLARGRYLARMDADDISMPDRFAKQVEYLEAHPECVIVGSRVMLMDPYGSPVAETGHKLTHEEIEHQLLTESGWAMVHPSVMMRRDAVNQVGGYDKRLVALRGPRPVPAADGGGEGRQPAGRTALVPKALCQHQLQQVERAGGAEGGPPGPGPRPTWPATAGRLEIRALDAAVFTRAVQALGLGGAKAGNVKIARKHAMNALRRAPSRWRRGGCSDLRPAGALNAPPFSGRGLPAVRDGRYAPVQHPLRICRGTRDFPKWGRRIGR